MIEQGFFICVKIYKNLYLYKNLFIFAYNFKTKIMYTLLVVVVYFIMMVLLLGSKLKTTWIIWVAFFVGFSLASYKEQILKFLINTL